MPEKEKSYGELQTPLIKPRLPAETVDAFLKTPQTEMSKTINKLCFLQAKMIYNFQFLALVSLS